MIVYLDTSAIVKLYVAEEWSAETAAVVESVASVTTVALARVELSAALARAAGPSDGRQQAVAKLLEQFGNDWTTFGVVPVDDSLLDAASAVAVRHRLRAYDAVHLAAAAKVRLGSGEETTLATFDRELWRAADAEGLISWPAGLGT